jgi:predicted ATP-dependent endonuclease of OLD family
MQYRKFTICNYRAITGPLEVNVGANPLIPIIGINECGKTTILSAIFAFDYNSDLLNEGRHLRDTHNLYRTTSGAPVISAEIALTTKDFVRALEDVSEPEFAGAVNTYRRKRGNFPKILTIERNLAKDRYRLNAPGFSNIDLNDKVARQLILRTPYILYFDDFRDSVEEKIEIKGTEDDAEGWLSIIQQLFKQTDKDFSVFQLGELDERRRKAVLAKVQRRLNQTLTREWQNFRLDDSDALEIAIEYQSEQSEQFIKLEIIETDADGDKHYFFVRDRSKGFFWFFNFVMKLEFNPKVVEDKAATVYLLDEPGSYLHASAQTKLCRKLQQLSSTNRVIYCTHSHYLLDPEVIPLSAIKVAEKSGIGSIDLIPIHEHKGNITERRSAFQPVIDALHVKPIMLDLTTQCVIIVEGIFDYYALELFRQGRNVSILPSVGAESLRFYISLCIASHGNYKALWDNDETGRRERQRAMSLFGEMEGKSRFFLLPLLKGKTRILQDLFEGEDIRMVRTELRLPPASSFEKTIAALHFAPEKAEVLAKLTDRTRGNFADLYSTLGFGLE